jgi:hypothetical protein
MPKTLLTSLLLLTTLSLRADDPKKPDPPEQSKSTAEILKSIDPLKGFGSIHTAEFHDPTRHVFLAWYCPFSGRAACRVHAYTFDPKTELWTSVLDRLFDHTHTVSAESPTRTAPFALRNVKGEVIYTHENPK